jgi:two-component system OmpR family response regulator
MRILIVEDEAKLAQLVARGLREEGHAVDVVGNGEEALWLAGTASFDAIVLDVMLPGLDGFGVCRRLREQGIWVPVLMLTAREAVEDRIAGLDAGADDYLAKPFSFDELVARLRALTRRAPVERPTLLTVGELRLDPAAHRVWSGESELELSAKEFRRRPVARSAARRCVGSVIRAPLERHRCLHPLSARQGWPRDDRDCARGRLSVA